jgi:DNA-binding transcriptional ArsR family regulator
MNAGGKAASKPRVVSEALGIDAGAEVCKALGDAGRLRILLALHDRELCVCQIVALLSLAPSTVSRHLHVLRAARLIESYKRGRWVYYRWAGAAASRAILRSLAPFINSLSSSEAAEADRSRLGEILAVNPEELCLSYYGN